MKRTALRITLLEDAVFSERPSTEGGHRGLNYIPGSALLGAAAARLYRRLPRETAWLLFHSGKVRFGNALPSAEGEQGYPVPFALHYAKGATWKQEGCLSSRQVVNLAAGDEARALLGELQPKQLREGFLTPSGKLIEPKLNYRMKTAIDAGKGRAAEGQLFGYNALPAGTLCVGELSADDDIPEDLWQQLLAIFDGEILLGRSRSAEYGCAAVRLAEPAPLATTAPETEMVLWLLSDLAACDPWGQPTVEPLPEWLGLPKGEIVWERSFVRTRRYAPWNAYRNSRDPERVVLQAGSVITYSLSDRQNDPWSEIHDRRVAAGLGLYRECGLGKVWVNPPMLHGQRPQLEQPVPVTSGSGDRQDSNARPPLIDWLEETDRQRARRQDLAAEATAVANELMERYQRARRYAGLRDDQPIGPSVSQWGSVLNVAKSARSSWREDLFDEANGVCRAGMEGWSDEFPDNGKRSNFHQWLRDQVDNREPRFVQELAHTVKSRLRQPANVKGGKK